MIMLLSLLVMPLQMQPRIRFIFVDAAAHCWLLWSLLSTRTSRSLTARLLHSHKTYPVVGSLVILSQVQDFLLSLLNFILISLTICSNFFQGLCKMVLPCDVFTSPPFFVSPGSLIRMLSIASSRSFMKMLNTVRPSINSWDTLLETSCQPE